MKSKTMSSPAACHIPVQERTLIEDCASAIRSCLLDKPRYTNEVYPCVLAHFNRHGLHVYSFFRQGPFVTYCEFRRGMTSGLREQIILFDCWDDSLAEESGYLAGWHWTAARDGQPETCKPIYWKYDAARKLTGPLDDGAFDAILAQQWADLDAKYTAMLAEDESEAEAAEAEQADRLATEASEVETVELVDAELAEPPAEVPSGKGAMPAEDESEEGSKV